MKIALLNDTHFGVRNDSMIFDDFLHKFYEEVFFPYLEEHNIKTLIHLGDWLIEENILTLELQITLKRSFYKNYG